jgi:3-dehydrosphinganine reductase
VILARDMQRLSDARAELAGQAGGVVDIVSVDVDDALACQAVIDDVVRGHGRIDWLITSAGTAAPGLFLDLDLATHHAQMTTNYFGTLNLVRPALPALQASGGRITLISSAAAFLGIVGYSAYAPGKFALRALAEILRLELEPLGITVGIAFPPDTETPQLERERQSRPLVTRLISEQGGSMTAAEVARRILRQAEAGRFILAPSLLVALLARFGSLYAPVFARQQRRLLRRAREHGSRPAQPGSGAADRPQASN